LQKRTIFFVAAQQGHTEELPRNLSPNRILCGLFILQGTLCFVCGRKLSEFVLKVYYPIEFMVVINNQGGFIEPKSMCMKQNVRATIHNPCVNKSEFTNTLYTAKTFI
jgi:DNA polymerase-3 subunit alpha/error-prone DNA polymerase